MKARQGLVAAVLGAALVGCGVQPTGVVDAGEPAAGLSRGMRLYYESDTGLRAVPMLDRKIEALDWVVKLLLSPPPVGQGDGLTTLVVMPGPYSATGTGKRVTLHMEGLYPGDGKGQLVCSLARAQSVLEPKVRAAEVEVTLKPSEGAALGPHRCAEFLNR
ncbi:hypothetical protein [Streptomyces sp. NPDC005955]|uniref:hypothetical protein n=1 Tax=Streptomyces sp. NPDC005955 TaxID=3364738 RepID=UPI0036BE790D